MRIIVHAFLAVTLIASGPSITAQQAQTGAQADAPPPQNGQSDTAPPAPQRVRISGGMMAGQIISRTNPVYPHTNAEGSVILHAIIGKDGTVQNLSVISGPEPLRDAAIDAVRRWRYRPYLLNGTPVAVETTVTINFRR